MKLAQLIELADSDRHSLLFDLKAKALVSGNAKLLEGLEGLNGEGDSAELLGELQMLGALPDIEADDAHDPEESERLAFPMAAFPAWLQSMVEQAAACCQVTQSHAAQDARMALNALIGPSLRYEITEDWTRQAGLFLCIVGESGSGKSRTSRQFMAPMYDLQKDITAKAERGLINARVDAKARDAEREELEKQLKDLFKPGKKKPAALQVGDRDKIKERIAELEAEAKAAALDAIDPTLWETDVTIEYLLRVMIDNGGRVSLIGMETPLFGILAGRYSQGVIESVEVFNDAFDGMPVSAGRMKSKKVVCDEPCLAVSIGTQPSVLFKTGASSTLLERGTLARFSFYQPTSLLGHRDMKLKRIEREVRETYLANMRELAEAYRAAPPEEGEPFERMEPTTFKFSDNAVQRFEKWRQLREAERQQGGRLQRLTGFQARIDDMLPRTAVQLHVLWNGASAPPYISEETVERAIMVTEFDIQGTDAVFSKMGLDTVARIADAIEDWAIREKAEETTVQKLSRVPLGMEKTADQVRAACRILEREAFLSLVKVTKSKGGRPSERIFFNLPV